MKVDTIASMDKSMNVYKNHFVFFATNLTK